MHFKYLIIGGGVAGTTAAETIRKNDSQGSIAIISDEPYHLYSRIMLSKPNFFLGQIPFDKVWLKDEEWYKTNKITFIGGKSATNIDAKNKFIKLSDNTELEYEKLLLATGACARPWKVEGGDDKQGIFQLRTLDDGKALIAAAKTAKHAIAIGSAFITFEMADILRQAGVDFTVVMLEAHFWEPVFDEIGGQIIEKVLMDNGVKIIRRSEIVKVLGDKTVAGIILKNGSEIPCDMIICGIGLVCPMQWLKDSGLNVNRGILANEYLETSLPDVWTAGDVAEFKDPILEEIVQLGNWVNAQEQGKTAGLNMLGQKKPFRFVSFYSAHGFGAQISFIGDVRPLQDREFISRGSTDTNSYARMIILNKELVGAVLINRNQDLKPISKLIENNVDVTDKLDKLADSNFDLKTLLA